MSRKWPSLRRWPRWAVLVRFLQKELWSRLGPRNGVILLAGVIGMAAGLLAVLLKNGVGWLRSLPQLAGAAGTEELLFVLPTIGLVLTHLLVVNVFGGRHPGPGIPSTLHALSRMRARLSRMSMVSPAATSLLTVGFGGSAGLEAPAVQGSAAIASEVAERFKLDYRYRLVLIGCAATASLAAMFKAPLAAIVFAVEVIMIDLTTASLVPLLVASLSALLTTTLFIDPEELMRAGRDLPAWDGTVLAYLPFAVLCGLASVWFSDVYRVTGGLVKRFRHPLARIVLSGAAIGGVLMLFPSLYGEGFELINELLRGRYGGLDPQGRADVLPGTTGRILLVMAILWACKPALTGLTVGAGGVGGVFAPALVSGALLGGIFLFATDILFPGWHLIGGHFVLAGMAGLMAGILRAPLTAIFLTAEASGGYDLFIPFMLTSAIAFQVARVIRPNSIYTQELADRGELITHDKDKAVLTLMKLGDQIETDFDPVRADWTLGQLVGTVAQSRRNIHPVIDDQGALQGIVPLEEIRGVMFDHARYDALTVQDLMVMPAATLEWSDAMESVMDKFDRTQAWNLPVTRDGRYVGFVSRSKLFGAYRSWLQEVSDD